jgi:DNA-binding transcriptional MerR regulator
LARTARFSEGFLNVTSEPAGQVAFECALTLTVRHVTGWTTREAAEKCGLSQHTVRWYERIGLLDRVSRTPDGRRRFSDTDLDWLVLLSRLRATGMPVRDMLRYAELVRSGAGEAERVELLQRHRDRVSQALLDQQECLKLLDAKIGNYCEHLLAVQSDGPRSGPVSAATVGLPARADDTRRNGRN